MAKKKSYWSHLPKSSGLGKLSKKHKRVTARIAKHDKKVIKSRVGKVKTGVHHTKVKIQRSRAQKAKQAAQNQRWVFWGSRQTLEAKDSVVASLKRQGYKVRVDGTGQGYKIYTWGKASYHS